MDCNKYKMFYVSLIIATDQKPLVDTQKVERNLNMPLWKIINSQSNRATVEKRNKRIPKQPENM